MKAHGSVYAWGKVCEVGEEEERGPYVFRTSPESGHDFALHAQWERRLGTGIGSDDRGTRLVWRHVCGCDGGVREDLVEVGMEIVGGAQELLSARLSIADLGSCRLATEYIFPREAGTCHNYSTTKVWKRTAIVLRFIHSSPTFFFCFIQNGCVPCAGGPAPMKFSSLGRISQNAAGAEPQIFYADTFLMSIPRQYPCKA